MVQGSAVRSLKRIGLASQDVQAVFDDKYPETKKLGWGPVLRRSFGYFSPDDYYEAIIAKLLRKNAAWADVGCGRDIFPSNVELAARLARRCDHVIGIDPDPNIQENPFLTEKHQGMVDDFAGSVACDLVTMRMVAEHIANPGSAMRQVSGMLKQHGSVVILTPHKRAPLSLLARLIPFRIHHPVKRFFWGTEERDTFPVEFKMNTRTDLARLAEYADMDVVSYGLYADCSVFSRFRWLNRFELAVWKILDRLGATYPESCIIAVFRKR